jgi:RimJ/RimL family protein N-acetyltransferase
VNAHQAHRQRADTADHHRGRCAAVSSGRARFGLTQLGLARLEIVTLVHNTASRRVAEKLGATFECIARNRLSGWGRSHDAAMYSLTPDDLKRA